MFVVDTNVWLELLLEQEKAGEVRRFLEQTDASQLAITDFSLHSIALILCRLGKDAVLLEFLSDTLAQGGVRLEHMDLEAVLIVRRQFNLDFDDAYQYVAATRDGSTLGSFDTDFDRTERGRMTPLAALGV
jgi:predicted nucleic acid-binding protein